MRTFPPFSLVLVALSALASVAVALPLAGGQAKLRPTPFPDGTGSIGLPEGWSLQGAYRGQVGAENGAGETVILGLPWTILKPGGSLGGYDAAAGVPTAAPGDIARAIGEVLAKKSGARLLSLRSRPGPVAVAGAPALYCLYEMEQGGTTLTALGYFTALDPGPTSPSWSLYSSAVIAPKARFVKSLPTLMAIWRSWKPNGADPLRGSQSAKLDEVLQGRKDSYQKIQDAFRKEL